MFQPQQAIFPPQMMIPRTAHMQPHMSVPIGQALPLPHLQYQNYPHGLLSKEQHNDQLHYGINMNAPLQQQPSQQAPLRPQSQSLNQVLNPGGPQQPYNVNHPPQQNYGMGMQGVNQQLLNQHQPAPNQPLSSQQVLNQTYPHQHYPNQQQNQQQQYPNAKNQPSIVPEEEEPNTPFQMFDSKSPQGNTPNLPSLSPFALPQTPTPNKLPISAITPIQSTTPTAPTTTTQTTTSTTSTAASAPTAQAPPSNSNTKKSSWMKLKSEMNQKTQETKKNQEASAPKVSTVAVSGGPVSPAPAKPKTPQAPTPKNHNPPQEDEEDELRSDDDDDSDEEPLTENLIVCTFDKVSRVKNKWKITLKCGVMNLNGRDYLFHRATGEGEW
uniref:Uncharacterized protein n=1 Tax=Arcella intermedia TaxID=1963864 RepID=A0A6B2L763_9EUKA